MWWILGIFLFIVVLIQNYISPVLAGFVFWGVPIGFVLYVIYLLASAFTEPAKVEQTNTKILTSPSPKERKPATKVENWWDVLGINSSASMEVIQKTYHEMI